MIFPFLLKYQQAKLTDRIEKVGLKHQQTNYKHIDGVHVLTASVNQACDMHNTHLKTKKGFVKSIIPFTFEFKTRIVCAQRISELHKKFDEVEKAISKGRPKVTVNDKQIKKSHSDSEVVLQRKQYSKVLQPAQKIKEAEDVIKRLDNFNNPKNYGKTTRYAFN